MEWNISNEKVKMERINKVARKQFRVESQNDNVRNINCVLLLTNKIISITLIHVITFKLILLINNINFIF